MDFLDNEDIPWREKFDPETLIGWVIADKYKIIRHLGGGGFGEVYEAQNINLMYQRVVIKFLKQIRSRERFAKEAKILCQLDHPNICRIIDFLEKESALVMQYIDGKDLEVMLSESGPPDENTILKVANSICSAVSYAHGQRIAHRDVKPKNVMIDANRHVYLIDFGIAKEIDATAMTGTGQVVLTPQYAAPERMKPGVKYDPFLSDVFEIGATIYKLCTDSTP